MGGNHLNRLFIDHEQRHVQSTAPKVVDDDPLHVGFLIKTVGDRRRGGLVNDPHDLEASCLVRVNRGLALPRIEFGRHRHHSSCDLLVAKVEDGNVLQALEDMLAHRLGGHPVLVALGREGKPSLGANFRHGTIHHAERVDSALFLHSLIIKASPNEALGIEDDILRV
mmetsp:Transcript_33180/g.96098  ORF Transcript_33180/g.96098 Transcript_33180/m.96098 type:complete len:168 (-) Transcript_33180:329-832(-)